MSEDKKRWTINEIREASPDELEEAFGSPECEVIVAPDTRMQRAADGLTKLTMDRLITERDSYKRLLDEIAENAAIAPEGRFEHFGDLERFVSTELGEIARA